MNGQRGGRHQRDQDASPDEAGVRNKKHSRADSVREPRFSSNAQPQVSSMRCKTPMERLQDLKADMNELVR